MTDKEQWSRFDVEDDEGPASLKEWVLENKTLVGGVGAIVLLLPIGVWGLVSTLSGTAAPQEPLIQRISIVQPPPPPPPPKVEQPEPEIEEIELEEPEPEQMADDVAESDESMGEELGLDADGVAGSDGFGLKANRGGRGLIGADPNAWYAGIITRDLQSFLSDQDTVRVGEYSVVVSIWLNDDGLIQDSELLSGTNDPVLDAALRDALSTGVQISRQPPEGLPQPVRLRITSRT